MDVKKYGCPECKCGVAISEGKHAGQFNEDGTLMVHIQFGPFTCFNCDCKFEEAEEIK